MVWKFVSVPPSQTLGYIERLTSLGFRPNDLLELSLRAYEQDAVAAHHDLADEILCSLDLTKGLLEIDEIDPGPLGENNRRILGFHRRVWWPKWTPASNKSCSVGSVMYNSVWVKSSTAFNPSLDPRAVADTQDQVRRCV